MAKIDFNDLYINRDDGSLWTEQIFKAQYNHYKGEDEAWSKPYEEWKEWYVDGADGMPFVSLEQFLENNWFGISNSIEEAHSGFIGLFQNGESKSEVFLNFVCMFNDLDQHFADTLYLDVEDMRAVSPVQEYGDALKKVYHHLNDLFPDPEHNEYFIYDDKNEVLTAVWLNLDGNNGNISIRSDYYNYEALVRRYFIEAEKNANVQFYPGYLNEQNKCYFEEASTPDIWNIDFVLGDHAQMVSSDVLLKDVIDRFPKQAYRTMKNKVLEEQGKTLDYHDFGKIIRDKVDEAIDGEEYCWYVMNKSDYSDDDWKEFEEDLETLTPEQRQCIEFGDEPTVSFLGDFIKLFEEDQWLLDNNIYQYWCKNDLSYGIEFKDTEFYKKMENDSTFKKMAIQDFIRRCAFEVGQEAHFYTNGVILADQKASNLYMEYESEENCLKEIYSFYKENYTFDYDYKIDFIEGVLSKELEKEHIVPKKTVNTQSNESSRAILLANVINLLETSQDLLREYFQEEVPSFEGSLSEIECQIEDIDRSIDGLYDLAEDLNLDLNSFKEKNEYIKE